MGNWKASNRNPRRETIGDQEYLPFWYVVSSAGIALERDDGQVRTYQRQETAQRAADKLNNEATP